MIWLDYYCYKSLQIPGLMKTPKFAELFTLIQAVSFPFSTICPWKHFWIVLLSCSSAPCVNAGACDSQVHLFWCNSPSHTDTATIMKPLFQRGIFIENKAYKRATWQFVGKKNEVSCLNFSMRHLIRNKVGWLQCVRGMRGTCLWISFGAVLLDLVSYYSIYPNSSNS